MASELRGFGRATVHTVNDTANHFTVYVNDLQRVLAEVQAMTPENAMQSAKATYVLSLERALFIQQAIEEKIAREHGA